MDFILLQTYQPEIFRLAQELTEDRAHQSRVKLLKKAIQGQDVGMVSKLLYEGLSVHNAVYPLLLIELCKEDIYTVYARMGIHPSIRDATLGDIKLWAEEYGNNHAGKTGLTQAFWISRHLCAAILRLGRLQFEPKPFSYPFELYRHRKDNRLLLFAHTGMNCDAEGYLSSQDKTAFTTIYTTEGSLLTAHQVDQQTGSIQQYPSIYQREELQLVFDGNSPALHVHIPKGEALLPSTVDESLQQARNHFSGYACFVCASWLLDPALANAADPSSNSAAFMQRFSKFPVPFTTPQIFERVFGFGLSREDVLCMQSRTKLQRAVQEALRKGVIFRTMGGYCL